jgi:polyisoprenoid-binding protein YceI
VEGQLKQGRINLNAVGAPGSLVFDMASFSADTPEARKFVGLQKSAESATQLDQINRTMRGDSVLDVAKFPAASFTIKQIKKLDKPSQRNLTRVQLDGDFSLRGATRPIQVVAEVEEKTGWTHLTGGFTLLQSQFGITPFKKAFGAVGVTDQLSVWGDLWISKQRQIAERPPVAR